MENEHASIEQEPEDLLVGEKVEEQENVEGAETGGQSKDGELTAAAALTSLVGKTDTAEDDENDEEEAEAGEEEDKEFEIPQRFTRSGRKRATPFPLKVSFLTAASSPGSMFEARQN